MIFQANSFAADQSPDDESVRAMKAALRDLKVSLRKPAKQAGRPELLKVLGDAREAIDRING